MFKYNNTHIFTGYLKQLLASFNLPSCKIYTQEFAKYLQLHGEEDPRVLESFDTVGELVTSGPMAVRINYLKHNELYNYYSKKPGLNSDRKRDSSVCSWKRSSELFYSNDKVTRGLTRSLSSPGNAYDTATHEYLGEYLRFLRDYYDVNLMSLYNCFNNKICNNINFTFSLADGTTSATFSSKDSTYRIYAIPVKLFAEYTIAIDCDHCVELFCGLYNTSLDVSLKAKRLAAKTYTKVNKTLFSRPFLYDKLSIKHWFAANDFYANNTINNNIFTRWDLTTHEKDLRLFIKVPTSCKSSITILEGDYRGFSDFKYSPAPVGAKSVWLYQQNRSVLNCNKSLALNEYSFKPIGKLQLLTLNTGESYPFADRLVEYLIGSAITSIDEIPDNIKRAQKVMEQNGYYFEIDGLWENKMQNILYDFISSSGPIAVTDGKLVDKRIGVHPRLGHTNKSTLYDVLGYVDKDTEKWYASWKIDNGNATIKNNIQNVDIYNGLYDI